MNDNEIRKNIAENLKRLREEHDLSQTDLGTLFGKEKTTISTWERGVSVPDIVTLYKLSKLYGVELEDFYVNMNGSEAASEKKKKYAYKRRIKASSIPTSEAPRIIGELNGMPIFAPGHIGVKDTNILKPEKKKTVAKAARVIRKGKSAGNVDPAGADPATT